MNGLSRQEVDQLIGPLKTQTSQAADFYTQFPDYDSYHGAFGDQQLSQSDDDRPRVMVGMEDYHELRVTAEKTFRDLIRDLVVEYGYTQLVTGSVNPFYDFNYQLVFYGDDWQPGQQPKQSLNLDDLSSLLETEAPENNLRRIVQIQKAEALVAELRGNIQSNRGDNTFPQYIYLSPYWGWSQKKRDIVFYLNPMDQNRYNYGAFTALELAAWVYYGSGPIVKPVTARA